MVCPTYLVQREGSQAVGGHLMQAGAGLMSLTDARAMRLPTSAPLCFCSPHHRSLGFCPPTLSCSSRPGPFQPPGLSLPRQAVACALQGGHPPGVPKKGSSVTAQETARAGLFAPVQMRVKFDARNHRETKKNDARAYSVVATKIAPPSCICKKGQLFGAAIKERKFREGNVHKYERYATTQRAPPA